MRRTAPLTLWTLVGPGMYATSMTKPENSRGHPASSSLADWVCSYLGLAPQDLGVYESSLRLAVAAAKALNGMKNRLGEEDLTACLLGGLVASLPLSSLAFGYSNPLQTSFGWARYSKNGTERFAEANKGADFALLLTFRDGRSRLAIFQAKSDASSSATRNTISLSQAREVSGQKRYQVQVLQEYAETIMARVKPGSAGSEKITWVHYLAQMDIGLRCVPMCDMSTYISGFFRSRAGRRRPGFPVDARNSFDFIEVIEDLFLDKPKHWIELDAKDSADLLPDLIDMDELAGLMSIVVSTTGNGDWDHVPDGLDREDLAGVAPPDSPFITPHPVPSAGVRPGLKPKG